MELLVFSTRTKESNIKELSPEKRRINNGTVVVKNNRYSYTPSVEYEKHLAQSRNK